MKEQDYVDSSDLAKLRTIKAILSDCVCMDDPNKKRLASVKANISLMVDNLFKQIDISEDA